jgi:hypothetical protein
VADELDIILGGARPEASDALFTLVRSLKGAPDVRIFDYRRDGAITRLADTRFDPATEQRPLGWQRLLNEVLQRELPPLVRDVMDKVEREELRAYPMLAQPGWWSIRLEGLEVTRLDAAAVSSTSARLARTTLSARHAGCGSKLANQARQETCEPTIPARLLPLPGKSRDSPRRGSTQAVTSRTNTRWNHAFSAATRPSTCRLSAYST